MTRKSKRRGRVAFFGPAATKHAEKRRPWARLFPRFLPLDDWQSLPIVSGLVNVFRCSLHGKRSAGLALGGGLSTRLSPRVEQLEDRRLLSVSLYVQHPGALVSPGCYAINPSTHYSGDWYVQSDNNSDGVLDAGDTVVWEHGTGKEQDGLTWGVNAFGTIQSAINDPAGDTINVGDGVFAEQLEITRPLTLVGDGASTVIQSPASLTLSYTTSAVNKPIVYVHDTDGVTIEQLKVDGAGYGNANFRFEGIAYVNAGGLIDTVEVANVEDTPFSDALDGVGIHAYAAAGTARSLEVRFVNVHDFQKAGMVFQGVNLSVDAHDNVVTGAGDTTVLAQNGIQISGGATGSIIDNTVSDVAHTAAGYAATAILGSGAGGTLTISGNVVSNSQIGIDVNTAANITDNTITGQGLYDWGIIASGPATITGNTVADNFVAIYTTGTATVSSNTVTGFDGINDYGIYAVGSSTITQNNVSGANVAVYLEPAGGSTFDVRDNTLSGSDAVDDVGLYVYGSPANATMDLGTTSFSGNFGRYICLDDGSTLNIDATSASFDGKTGAAMSLPELYSTEDKITHGVDQSGLGFVRVKAGNVYVTELSGSIQRGIDVASPGDTINVEGPATAYAGGIVVDKDDLTLLGSGMPTVGAGDFGDGYSAHSRSRPPMSSSMASTSRMAPLPARASSCCPVTTAPPSRTT